MSRTIRTGIVGIGNCAAALVQGLSFYRGANEGAAPIGLLHPECGSYTPQDIQIVSAFDVSDDKVGLTLDAALTAAPNNTLQFSPIASSEVVVARGPTLDGLGLSLAKTVIESTERPVDVAQILRETETKVLVSYLPVGSEQAARFYAEAALEAQCAFINCMPAFIASDGNWASRFAERGTPIIGDDIKSQLGATILHRAIATLFRERGLTIDRQYQLNFGGNSDFLNMLDRDRLKSKKISKTQAVTSQMDAMPDAASIHIGPSDFVPWLDDRKVCHIRVEGRGFGHAPITIDLRLEVWDSPNSAGIVIDAIRCTKIALDHGIGGPLLGPCAWFMKSPPQQFTDAVARTMTLDFMALREK